MFQKFVATLYTRRFLMWFQILCTKQKSRVWVEKRQFWTKWKLRTLLSSNSDAMTTILSALYAKLLVVLGMAFPVTEITSAAVSSHYYDGFYLYLYLGTIFFIAYMYSTLVKSKAYARQHPSIFGSSGEDLTFVFCLFVNGWAGGAFVSCRHADLPEFRGPRGGGRLLQTTAFAFRARLMHANVFQANSKFIDSERFLVHPEPVDRNPLSFKTTHLVCTKNSRYMLRQLIPLATLQLRRWSEKFPTSTWRWQHS